MWGGRCCSRTPSEGNSLPRAETAHAPRGKGAGCRRGGASLFAVLAFALSFDEIVVTTFTAGNQETLPIWMFNQPTKPRSRPVTNIVALFVTALTTIPILVANRLTRGSPEG